MAKAAAVASRDRVRCAARSRADDSICSYDRRGVLRHTPCPAKQPSVDEVHVAASVARVLFPQSGSRGP